MDKTIYKDVYVFIEQREGVIQSVSLELLGKAVELAAKNGEKVCALLLGDNIKGLADDCIAYGADKVIVAIILPPKAGRVIIRFPSSEISRAVQSAVRPVDNLAESLGPKSRPIVVAPIRIILGSNFTPIWYSA